MMPETQPPKTSPKRSTWLALSLCALLLAGGAYSSYENLQWKIPSPAKQKSPPPPIVAEPIKTIETQPIPLSNSPPPALTQPETNAPSDDIERRLTRLENDGAQNLLAARTLLSKAFAYIDLREAQGKGRPFAPQLAKMRQACAGNPETAEPLALLDNFAEHGVPTISRLRTELESIAKNLTPASAPTEEDNGSWQTQLKTAMKALVSVRPLHDNRLDAVNKALEEENAKAALDATNELPADIREKLLPWQTKLEAKIKADAALNALADKLAPTQNEGAAE